MDQQDAFSLTANFTEYVPAFPPAEPAAEASAAAQEPAAPEDTFAIPAAGPVALVAEEAMAEPAYYLYWMGEGDTMYWLSETPLSDYGTPVAGGAALYAQFGVLGAYIDMDLAAGFGGIRPIEHMEHPELWQDEYFATLA